MVSAPAFTDARIRAHSDQVAREMEQLFAKQQSLVEAMNKRRADFIAKHADSRLSTKTLSRLADEAVAFAGVAHVLSNKSLFSPEVRARRIYRKDIKFFERVAPHLVESRKAQWERFEQQWPVQPLPDSPKARAEVIEARVERGLPLPAGTPLPAELAAQREINALGRNPLPLEVERIRAEHGLAPTPEWMSVDGPVEQEHVPTPETPPPAPAVQADIDQARLAVSLGLDPRTYDSAEALNEAIERSLAEGGAAPKVASVGPPVEPDAPSADTVQEPAVPSNRSREWINGKPQGERAKGPVSPGQVRRGKERGLDMSQFETAGEASDAIASAETKTAEQAVVKEPEAAAPSRWSGGAVPEARRDETPSPGQFREMRELSQLLGKAVGEFPSTKGEMSDRIAELRAEAETTPASQSQLDYYSKLAGEPLPEGTTVAEYRAAAKVAIEAEREAAVEQVRKLARAYDLDPGPDLGPER